ncbi:tetratricopeptide repeat protein [Nostoc sp. WHI]|uniref:tetratricopeptide repeat protein n=1 Tax=Nostoc sp. WHI TaxID=2650611 RepID=UPI0018C57006|nr:tetratricopeptide repeat protein [Nostoc sp. WHI]MBG1270678.1 tetratricopeptide repeat protein [Nostoc sp. WHI]
MSNPQPTQNKSPFDKIWDFFKKIQKQIFPSFVFAYNSIVVFSTIFWATIVSLAIIFSLTNKDIFKTENHGFYISFLVVIIAIVGIFPASYFAYLFYITERTQAERIKNDLKLLGLVSEEEYNDFDKLYKTVYDPIQFGTFILLLTSIATLVFTIYYVTKIEPDNNNKIVKFLTGDKFARNQLGIIFYAFLGAYLFGIRLVIRRYNTFDLQPQVYATIVLRILVSGAIAFGMGLLIEQGDITSEMSKDNTGNTKASDVRTVQQQNPSSEQQTPAQAKAKELIPWQILAFLIGFFPEQGLRWIVLVGKRAFRDPTLYQYSELPLRKILGINEWHQSRLEELEIDDAQALATADISKLLLTTQFDTMQVINWIDQAILHMKAGARTEQFIAFQITTYHELYTLLNQIKVKVYEAEVTRQGRNNYSEDTQNETQQNPKVQKSKLLDALHEITSHLKTTPSKISLQEDYSKLLVGLGFNLTELERLCDHSNYPNYVRIEEYYKNLENITREQAKQGAKEIIRSIGFGGEVVDITRRNYGKSLTSQEREEIENQVSRISAQLLFSRPTLSNAEAWVQLGIGYYSLNRLFDAENAYDESLKIDPQAGAYIGRSLIYIAFGNKQRDNAKQKEKEKKLLLEQNKNEDEQGSTPNEITQLSSKIIKLHKEISSHYTEAQNYYEKAISDNTFAIRIVPSNADAFNNRALAYMEQGNLVAALENLEIALQYNHSLATAYYNRGTIRNTLGTSEKNFIEAAFDMERAYLLGYRPAALWVTWGLVLLNTGHYQEAVEKFSQAICLRDENHALHYARRGFAYVQLSKEAKLQKLNYFSEYAKQASRDFDRAIELSPELAITYIHYGYLKRFESKYDQAIDYYKKAIEQGANDYIVYANLAEVYFQWAQFKSTGRTADNTDARQDYEESIKNYETAIELEDKRPETFFNLAVAYYITDNIDNARDKALESDRIVDELISLESSRYSSSLLEIKQLKEEVSEFLKRLPNPTVP